MRSADAAESAGSIRDVNIVQPKTIVLKIDQDCFVDPGWTRDYIWLAISTCRRFRLKIVRIRTCESARKGIHYYIDLARPINFELANRLQFLLGDDRQRVDFNRARIESKLSDPIKLFEKLGSRLRTIYDSRVAIGTQSNAKRR